MNLGKHQARSVIKQLCKVLHLINSYVEVGKLGLNFTLKAALKDANLGVVQELFQPLL